MIQKCFPKLDQDIGLFQSRSTWLHASEVRQGCRQVLEPEANIFGRRGVQCGGITASHAFGFYVVDGDGHILNRQINGIGVGGALQIAGDIASKLNTLNEPDARPSAKQEDTGYTKHHVKITHDDFLCSSFHGGKCQGCQAK